MPRNSPQQSEKAPSRPASLDPRRLGSSGARALAIGMIVLALWMLASFVGQVITSSQLERRREALEAQNALIVAENAALATEVAYAESPAYADRIAREQLGYAREGEAVILPTFPEITPTAAVPTAQPLPTQAPRANWRGWTDALFPTPEKP